MALGMRLREIVKRSAGITSNSKEVRDGFVFFAIRGTRVDGHSFVKEALKRGATHAVVEKKVDGVVEERLVVVDDTRRALGEASSLFYGDPSHEVGVIGITGTNGKTTVAHILESILTHWGHKCGVVGTISYRIGDEIIGEGRTTPEPVLWHSTLRKMADKGARWVVAEVSSHALDQKRVWGTRFHATVFTNLTRDHLDYHGTMEEYFRAKKRLFTEYESSVQVINTDDPYGRELALECPNPVRVGKEGELKVISFRTDFEGSEIELEWQGERLKLRSNLIGDFQKYNISLAVGTALALGLPADTIQKGMEEVFVPGRFEVHRSRKGFIVVIDYAHTPDAIDNVLRTVRRLAGGRVITVFGAGGDRDRSKRPLMGEAAKRWSDVVVVTSDNPRSEDPERIIDDILTAFGGGDEVYRQPDRKKAIEFAIGMARKGDIVALLGKGHEEYQEIGGVKYPFSDRRVVKELI